jgi:Ca2+-binding EF-hand superfamily protein
MGSGESKVVEAILHPDNEKAIEDLFHKFDADKSGKLELNEWQKFGKILFEVDMKECAEPVYQEIRHEFKTKALMMGGLMGSAAVSAAKVVNKHMKEEDVDHWIQEMFNKADTDKTGSLSLEEFKAFLQGTNLEEMKHHQQALRDAVADNIEQHGGIFEVQDGHTSIRVESRVDTEAIRKGGN